MSTSRFAIGATTLMLAVALAGCAAESSAEPSASPSVPSASASSSAPVTVSPSPTPSATGAAGGATLPDDCTTIYSAAMLATLETENPPLNDPGVTMYSTENATLLEQLDVLPTLRCSWGTPSEVGLATNVTVVDSAQSEAISAELAQAGFGCDTAAGATICRIEQRGVSLDDAEYTRGETHALRGDLWIATGWLNFNPEGYTEDILATLGE